MKNKDFKFRAWDEESKSYVSPKDIVVKPTRYGFKLASKFHLIPFSGLKTKKGVEIYAYDFIQAVYPTGPIRLVLQTKKGDFYAYRRLDDDMAMSVSDWLIQGTHFNLKVVGNWYLNPEWATEFNDGKDLTKPEISPTVI